MNSSSVHAIFEVVKDLAPNPRRAVIACGSWLRRNGSLARGTWSEFLPVNGRPVIDHVMDELRAAGFSEIECFLHMEPDALHSGSGIQRGEISADWKRRSRAIAYRHRRSFSGMGSIVFRAPLSDLSLEASLLRVAEDQSFAPFLLVFPNFISSQGAAELARLLETYRVYGASVMTMKYPRREVVQNSDLQIQVSEPVVAGAPVRVCAVTSPGQSAPAIRETHLREGCSAGRIVVNQELLSSLARLRSDPQNTGHEMQLAMQELADSGLLMAQPVVGQVYDCASVDGLLAASLVHRSEAHAMTEAMSVTTLFESRKRSKV